eukprot:g1964.t1
MQPAGRGRGSSSSSSSSSGSGSGGKTKSGRRKKTKRGISFAAGDDDDDDGDASGTSPGASTAIDSGLAGSYKRPHVMPLVSSISAFVSADSNAIDELYGVSDGAERLPPRVTLRVTPAGVQVIEPAPVLFGNGAMVAQRSEYRRWVQQQHDLERLLAQQRLRLRQRARARLRAAAEAIAEAEGETETVTLRQGIMKIKKKISKRNLRASLSSSSSSQLQSQAGGREEPDSPTQQWIRQIKEKKKEKAAMPAALAQEAAEKAREQVRERSQKRETKEKRKADKKAKKKEKEQAQRDAEAREMEQNARVMSAQPSAATAASASNTDPAASAASASASAPVPILVGGAGTEKATRDQLLMSGRRRSSAATAAGNAETDADSSSSSSASASASSENRTTASGITTHNKLGKKRRQKSAKGKGLLLPPDELERFGARRKKRSSAGTAEDLSLSDAEEDLAALGITVSQGAGTDKTTTHNSQGQRRRKKSAERGKLLEPDAEDEGDADAQHPTGSLKEARQLRRKKSGSSSSGKASDSGGLTLNPDREETTMPADGPTLNADREETHMIRPPSENDRISTLNRVAMVDAAMGAAMVAAATGAGSGSDRVGSTIDRVAMVDAAMGAVKAMTKAERKAMQKERREREAKQAAEEEASLAAVAEAEKKDEEARTEAAKRADLYFDDSTIEERLEAMDAFDQKIVDCMLNERVTVTYLLPYHAFYKWMFDVGIAVFLSAVIIEPMLILIEVIQRAAQGITDEGHVQAELFRQAVAIKALMETALSADERRKHKREKEKAFQIATAERTKFFARNAGALRKTSSQRASSRSSSSILDGKDEEARTEAAKRADLYFDDSTIEERLEAMDAFDQKIVDCMLNERVDSTRMTLVSLASLTRSPFFVAS